MINGNVRDAAQADIAKRDLTAEKLRMRNTIYNAYFYQFSKNDKQLIFINMRNKLVMIINF